VVLGNAYCIALKSLTNLLADGPEVDMDFIFAAEPDPGNSIIRFYYYLPEPENVQFEIYNLKGKVVSRISNGWLSSGVHVVFWSTDNLANGIYLIRFSVRDESVVQKVTLSV
jgi:hypothetical protein